MLKTSIKILLLFILIAAVALVTGFTTYNLTKRVADEKNIETVQAAVYQEKPQQGIRKTDTDSISEKAETASEYYTVRLEGTALGVYLIDDGKEEFLYHANVYKNDLSADDLKLLQQGVKLMDMSELTGFIENFTS